jgi:dTDP-4-amino-4,6-dideoxygalactose transaminase
MRDEFLVFGQPVIEEPEIAEVVDSMRSGWIGTGPKVQAFERMLEDYLGARHVRCVSSCTAALLLAFRTLRIGPGNEVIVPAMTFVATANAVELAGATPVLVDSDPRTGLVDLDAVEAAIGPKTRAVVPVHLAGRPVDVERLYRLSAKHQIDVVEDAAHAIGAEWRGRKIGAEGHAVTFSFYPTKNITTIEGGAIATDDGNLAAEAERLALHGLSLGAWQRFSDKGFKHYVAVEPGFKFNMTDIQAALGLHQLPRLDGWIESRAGRWALYDQLLADLPLSLPAPPEADSRHARHLYQVLVEPEAGQSRDEILDALTARRIGAGVHYIGVHLQPYYRERYSIAPGSLPVATDISERTLSLPLSPVLTEEDQEDVASALRAALSV